MNPQIEKLYQVSAKNERYIIGLMSGTSLDGLDIALCKFTGSGKNTVVSLEKFATIPFEEDFKNAIRSVFAKDTISFPHLCRLNPWIGNKHADLITQCLSDWGISPARIDAIASHGQTVMHSPKRLHKLLEYPNATLQIGDGDHIAIKTGILTLSDFRQKHCAVGGEGAPLALYGDYLLFSSKTENRILINIGGIANFTFLPKNQDFNKVFATDTGPGNTIIDAFVQKHFDIPFDDNAEIAKKGKLNETLLAKLLDHEYFGEAIPKTTGPELFNLEFLNSKIAAETISKEDILHTLCHFTSTSLTNEIKKSISGDDLVQSVVYLSGGGMHNPLICELIRNQLPDIGILNMDELGVSGDAKEAVLFAALANETLAGEKGFQAPNGSNSPFYMGKISFPV